MKVSVLKKALLLIHCDINKTIIVSDTSSGRGFLGSLNAILSECVFGLYPVDKPIHERQVEDWIPVSSSPESISKSGPVTFGTYLEDFTNINKQERKALKASFAESGGIGEQYSSYLEAIREKMKIDYSSTSTLPCLSDGYHFILPSFIKFLRYLTASRVSDRFDCRIVFRTIGSDIAPVATELNAFCHGSHPIFLPHTVPMDCYPNDFTLDMSDLSAESMSSISRSGPSEDDVTLNYFNEQTRSMDKIIGAHAGLNHITKSLLKVENNPGCRRCIAIRDDYSYWAAHNEADDTGKLLLIYPETIYDHQNTETVDRDVIYQMFFDDNIERDRAHIIDVRDIDTFASIPFQDALDRVMVRVEPYQAIVNEDYFIEQFNKIIQSWIK